MGVADIKGWMGGLSFTYGYGPFTDVEFESTLRGAVESSGGDWFADWAGTAFQGTLHSDVLGTATTYVIDYCFAYEMAGDGELLVDPDGYFVGLKGAAEAGTVIDGLHVCKAFFGFGWS